MKCGRTKSQELDVQKIVHIAMEKCLVGEMVYLAFCLTITGRNISHVQPNMLPVSKATNFNTTNKLPELLANGICRIQNEKKHKSIADFFLEYLNHFEKSVSSVSGGRIFTGKDCSHSFANHKNRISINETDCGICDVMSPHHFCSISSNRNNFVLSLMPSKNESSTNTDVLENPFSDFESIQQSGSSQLDQVKGNHSESRETGISCSSKNLMINDLQQSFCYSSNTNEPCMWTSIKKDTPSRSRLENITAESTLLFKSVVEILQPMNLSSTALDVYLQSTNQLMVRNTRDILCETACNSEGLLERDKDPEIPEFDMVFDSPTTHDLDAFLVDISFTSLAQPIDGNQNQSSYNMNKPSPREPKEATSALNIVCCDQPPNCLTSTPSLANHNYHKNLDVADAFDSTFSPIYSEFTPKSSERRCFETGDDSQAIISKAGKEQSKFGLSSRLLSGKSPCQKSSSKVSSSVKVKKRPKNLLKYILSSEKSSWCSNNSQLKDSVTVQQKNLSHSPYPFTRLVRNTTPREKWTDHSMSLFEDSKSLCASKEESIESNHTKTDRACLKSNVFDEKISSTCSSPLLFSP